MEMTTDRQAAGQRVRRRRRWGVVVGVAAAVLALSSCTVEFVDGQLRVACYESDYDQIQDPSGDYYYRSKIAGCYSLYGPAGGTISEWPIYGATLWP